MLPVEVGALGAPSETAGVFWSLIGILRPRDRAVRSENNFYPWIWVTIILSNFSDPHAIVKSFDSSQLNSQPENTTVF